MLYIRCLSFKTSSEPNSETRRRKYKTSVTCFGVIVLIDSERVLVKSTTGCMYRGNEFLTVSGEFGGKAFLFFK